MRIIAGQLKGRQFASPHGHKTHPMSDKVRGALFNVLGDISGLTVLDAFAGSGAVAFEAASRGASNVTAIEKDRAAHSVIDKNLIDLRIKNVHVSRANAGGWSIHNMERKFDVVLLDPPYDDVQLNLLQTLAKRHTKKGGIIVLSLPPKIDFKLAPSKEYELLADKNYGDAQLKFYRKSGGRERT